MTSRLLAILLALAPTAAGAVTLCSFSSTPGMNFGGYDDASPVNTDSTTSIVVQCLRVGGPADTDVTLQVGPSASSGTIATRQMRSGANAMNYNLYRDAGRSQVWGQSAGVDTVTTTVTNIPNGSFKSGTFIIYGRIPAQQNVAAGAYSDSVQITVLP